MTNHGPPANTLTGGKQQEEGERKKPEHKQTTKQTIATAHAHMYVGMSWMPSGTALRL